jgi:hypothetical protein
MPPLVRPPDFPALFPLGFHNLTLDSLELVCVDLFPLSVSRRPIMDGFREFVKTLTDSGYAGELWVDGSFLTEKIDPKDIDVVLRCDGERYNSWAPGYRKMVDWVIANQKAALKCDSHALLEYPEGAPLHDEGKWWYSYWHVKWGFSREEDPKGIVVISFGGGAI